MELVLNHVRGGYRGGRVWSDVNLHLTKAEYIRAVYPTKTYDWIQNIPFWKGLEVAGINIKKSVAWLERIPSTLELHNPTYGDDTHFYSLSGPLDTNPLYKWLELIRRGSY